MHEVGDACPECGTRHRVIESLPDRPMTLEEVEQLEESDTFEFVIEVGGYTGELVAVNLEKDVTREIITVTETTLRVISHYMDRGWIVEIERDVGEDESPREAGLAMFDRVTSERPSELEVTFAFES